MRNLPSLLLAAFTSVASAQMSWVEVPGSSTGYALGPWCTFDTFRNRIVESSGYSVREWDGTSWTPVVTIGGNGSTQGMAYDEARRRVVIAGRTGATSQTDWVNEWDGTSNSASYMSGGPTSDICFDPSRARCVGLAAIAGQTRLVSWDGAAWSVEPVPAAPFVASGYVVFDHARNRLLVLPTASLFATDLWQLAGGAWSPLPSVPGYVGQPIYDFARQGLLAIGLTGNSQTAMRFDGAWSLESSVGWPILAIVPRWSPCSAPSGAMYCLRGTLFEALRYPQAPLASVTQYGMGCPGPLGIPTLTVSNVPALGATVRVPMSGIPPYGLAYPYMFAGFDNLSCMGQPLPLNMAHFGMPGCALLTSSDQMLLGSDVGFTVPASATFTGVHLYFQGAALNLLGPNGPHASFTAGLDCMIGLAH